MKNIIQSGIENYGDIEGLVNAMKNNENIDLSDKIDDDSYKDSESIPQNSDIIKQKQALKDLKEELLEEKKFMQTSQIDNDLPSKQKKK